MKQERNRVTNALITVEDGVFFDGNGPTGLKRLLCETHGCDKVLTPLITPRERLALLRTPWYWCVGCEAIYNEVLAFPSNWFSVNAQ